MNKGWEKDKKQWRKKGRIIIKVKEKKENKEHAGKTENE